MNKEQLELIYDYVKSRLKEEMFNIDIDYLEAINERIGLLDKVAVVVCNYFKIRIEDLKSDKRDRIIVDARHIFSRVMREELKFTCHQIGDYLKKNHSTIVTSGKRSKELLESDKSFRLFYFDVYDLLIKQNIINEK